MSHEHAQPPDSLQELERLFGLVRIHSTSSFSYPQPPAPAATPPPTVNAEERRRLVHALRDTLYARCYARARVDARSDTEADLGAEEFARRLSAANRGREGWLEGWRLESVGAGGVVVAARGAERRLAAPGDYAMPFSEEVPPCVGCALTLRARKESTGLQEGVYCALGEEPPHAYEEGDVVRLYFNAPPMAALLLTEAATTHLNEWRAPFTLKVMLRPEDRDRRDAVVLYLPRELHALIFRLLERLPPRLFALLRPGVPLFAKPLGDGVGLAESPRGGESFGMHRCRLLAESIVDAWLDGHQDAEARRLAAESRFAAEGLSLERAYLNPGNADVYEPAPSSATTAPTRDASCVPTSFGMLTRTNVLAYLRARGLLAEGDDATSAWRVTEHHSRNHNFAVYSHDGAQAFFVKQLRAQAPESFRMLRREARIYELAGQDADFKALREVLPPFYGFDDSARATVLGALDGENLLSLQQRLGHFPPEFGRQLGRALATVHRRVGRAAVAHPPRGVFELEPPGVFTAHRGGPLVRWLGPGQMRLVEQVREHPRLSRVLDELAATWRRESFIHGDVKFENFVVAAGPDTSDTRDEGDAEAGAEIKLVDWELADFGEAAWDVGSLVQAYLALCLSHAPAESRGGMLEQLQASSLKYDRMRRAVTAFWHAYREEVALDEQARRTLIERTLLCASARLVQTALEVMHGRPQPTPLALSFLAASVEVATRTQETAHQLGLGN